METTKKNICPLWIGYTLLIPVRKYQHDPYKILGSHIKQGMCVMDYGSAMGYFSIPLAKMTGSKGKVFCVDIQEKMLDKLKKRAIKHKVHKIIKPLQVNKNYNINKLQNKLDFILLFMVVHEVPDKSKLFTDLFSISKTGAKVLFAEPKGHVTSENFEKSIQLAQAAGFKLLKEKPLKKGLSAFLVK